MNCPHTDQPIPDLSVYLRAAKKRLGLPVRDIRLDVMRYNYPIIATPEYMREHYVDMGWSLPDFQRETGLNYEQTQFLLDCFGISRRDLAAGTKACVGKRVATCLERYGVANPSQTEDVKEKKRQTFTEHYGVDNIWKTQAFRDGLDGFYLERYGVDYNDFQKGRSARVWAAKTPEQRAAWLDKSILSDPSYQNRGGTGANTSKMEDTVSSMLNDLAIPHSRWLYLKHGKKRYYYDICIPAINLIVEVNGDYWHANPLIYAADQVINYPFGQWTAAKVWAKDARKAEAALVHGYRVVYLWEAETKRLTKPQLKTLIEERVRAIVV